MKRRTRQYMPRARTRGMVIRKLEQEVVVYDMEQQQAHCLNETAARIWERCDGRSRVEEVIEQEKLQEEMIWRGLQQLSGKGLLEDRIEESIEEKRRMSRREMIKAAGAAAMIAGPIVSSIIAPKAAEASTCLGTGQSCVSSAQCCNGLCSSGLCA